MRIEIDTHTHTVLSGHAHSTILENAAYAAKIGLKGFVMTDHGPLLPNAPPEFNIATLHFIPEEIQGVRIYRGVEANIADFEGNIDIRERFLAQIDFAIAGLHEPVLMSGGMAKDTEAVLAALGNKYVDIIAHPNNPSHEPDLERIVKEASTLGKLLEVNDNSFGYRGDSANRAKKLVLLCKQYGVRVCVASDAHFAFGVGKFDSAVKLLEECQFPEELIVNLTIDRFESYLKERGKRVTEG